jgi:predicted ArsR family transcriptional regulator
MIIVDRVSGMDRDPLEAVTALSALGDPTRRRVYDFVSLQGRPVARDDVGSALAIGRTLAAYHLDRLAADGLLSVAFERRSGRTGPGAGRPAKVYERSQREMEVSLPPRDYGLAARLLAHAAAHDEHGGTRRALRAAADALGREIAAEAPDQPDLEPLLRERGYEPFHDDDHGDVVRLRNCPFHAVAQRHPEVVCDMNLSLLSGLLAGLDARDTEAVLEPGPGRCCVAIKPRSPRLGRTADETAG